MKGRINKREELLSIENQRKLMNKLSLKFHLERTEDWQYISKTKLRDGGGKFLLSIYSNDMQKMLKSIYPTQNFHYVNNSREYFKTFENHRNFLDNLSVKFELKSLDDWVKVSRKKMIQNGGKRLLFDYYENNLQKLLTSVYPLHPFPFNNDNNNNNNNNNNNEEENNNNTNNNNNNEENNSEINKNINVNMKKKRLGSIEKQREIIDKLYRKFGFTSLGDWLNITRKKIIKSGGKNLLLKYYANNLHLLLLSIYPNYPWQFIDLINNINKNNNLIKNNLNNIINNNNDNENNNNLNNNIINRGKRMDYFESIDNQRTFINELYEKFYLNSLDEWTKISRKKIIQNGGKKLILKYYENDLQKLLTSIYPKHIFPFDEMKNNNKNDKFASIEKQKIFMDELYVKFQLKSMDEWVFVTRKKLIQNGGRKLLFIYSNDMKSLLNSIYPSHHFPFDLKKKDYLTYFQSIENQKEFVDQLVKKLKLKWEGDIISLPYYKLVKNGGRILLSKYSNDRVKLLSSLYPHLNFTQIINQKNEEKIKKRKKFISMEEQKKIIFNLFEKLKINGLDDWNRITRKQFIENGGKEILKYYSNDLQYLLLSIYPSHTWKFTTQSKFLVNIKYFRNFLSILKEKFAIREKKDWYQIPVVYLEKNVQKILKIVHPQENWHRKLFYLRTKKTSQRLLFAAISHLFHSSLILENYRHPLLLSSDYFLPLELDVYLPTLNLAMEYQGEQHFDDIQSAGFSNVEMYQYRDRLKEKLVSSLNIHLISVPFWWDLSSSSLLSSISSHPFFSFLFSSKKL